MWKKLNSKLNFSDVVVAEMPDQAKTAIVMRNKLRRDKVISGPPIQVAISAVSRKILHSGTEPETGSDFSPVCVLSLVKNVSLN